MTGSRKKNKPKHPNQKVPGPDRPSRVRHVHEQNQRQNEELARMSFDLHEWAQKLHEWESSQQQKDRMKCRRCYREEYCKCSAPDGRVVKPVRLPSTRSLSPISEADSTVAILDGIVGRGRPPVARASSTADAGTQTEEELGSRSDDDQITTTETITQSTSQPSGQSDAPNPGRRGWWIFSSREKEQTHSRQSDAQGENVTGKSTAANPEVKDEAKSRSKSPEDSSDVAPLFVNPEPETASDTAEAPSVDTPAPAKKGWWGR